MMKNYTPKVAKIFFKLALGSLAICIQAFASETNNLLNKEIIQDNLVIAPPPPQTNNSIVPATPRNDDVLDVYERRVVEELIKLHEKNKKNIYKATANHKRAETLLKKYKYDVLKLVDLRKKIAEIQLICTQDSKSLDYDRINETYADLVKTTEGALNLLREYFENNYLAPRYGKKAIIGVDNLIARLNNILTDYTRFEIIVNELESPLLHDWKVNIGNQYLDSQNLNAQYLLPQTESGKIAEQPNFYLIQYLNDNKGAEVTKTLFDSVFQLSQSLNKKGRGNLLNALNSVLSLSVLCEYLDDFNEFDSDKEKRSDPDAYSAMRQAIEVYTQVRTILTAIDIQKLLVGKKSKSGKAYTEILENIEKAANDSMLLDSAVSYSGLFGERSEYKDSNAESRVERLSSDDESVGIKAIDNDGEKNVGVDDTNTLSKDKVAEQEKVSTEKIVKKDNVSDKSLTQKNNRVNANSKNNENKRPEKKEEVLTIADMIKKNSEEFQCHKIKYWNKTSSKRVDSYFSSRNTQEKAKRTLPERDILTDLINVANINKTNQ